MRSFCLIINLRREERKPGKCEEEWEEEGGWRKTEQIWKRWCKGHMNKDFFPLQRAKLKGVGAGRVYGREITCRTDIEVKHCSKRAKKVEWLVVSISKHVFLGMDVLHAVLRRLMQLPFRREMRSSKWSLFSQHTKPARNRNTDHWFPHGER